MNNNSTRPRTRTNLCSAQVVGVGLAALLIGGCKHAPAPAERSSPKTEQSQPANVKPAPAVPAVPAQPAYAGPRFAVQVDADENRNSAEALAYRLSSATSLQTLVAPAEVHGKTYYRVRIMTETKQEADSLANTLLRTYKLKVWIVPLR